jgi:hypothetical protein
MGMNNFATMRTRAHISRVGRATCATGWVPLKRRASIGWPLDSVGLLWRKETVRQPQSVTLFFLRGISHTLSLEFPSSCIVCLSATSAIKDLEHTFTGNEPTEGEKKSATHYHPRSYAPTAARSAFRGKAWARSDDHRCHCLTYLAHRSLRVHS